MLNSSHLNAAVSKLRISQSADTEQGTSEEMPVDEFQQTDLAAKPLKMQEIQ